MPIITVVGISLVITGVIAHHLVVARLFDCWHREANREWARVVKPARRAWPFSMFVWSHLYAWYERQWLWSTPEWALASPRANSSL